MDTLTEEIRTECRKLLTLLDDPHPGLITWNVFLAKTAKRLRDNLNQKLD